MGKIAVVTKTIITRKLFHLINDLVPKFTIYQPTYKQWKSLSLKIDSYQSNK